MVSRSDSVSSISSVSSLPNTLPKVPIGLSEHSDLSWKLDNKCFICQKKFGLGARHHCRYCGNSVCGKHSMKRKIEDSNETTRICENCDVELIKQEIRAEINEELARINDNIEISKENYEKIEEERQVQAKLASEIEEQMMAAEKEYRIKEQELNKRLNEEQAQLREKDLLLENMRKEFEESRNNMKNSIEKQKEFEDKIESMRNEISSLREVQSELRDNLARINKKMVGGLLEEQVAQNLCETCRSRVLAVNSEKSSFNE